MSPEVDKARATARLQQLSEEVGRIANVLAALSEHEAAAEAMAAVGGVRIGEDEPLDAGFIRSIIRARRLRDHFFKGGPVRRSRLGHAARPDGGAARGQRVAVSSLCIAAAVPPTTALRWIKSCATQGLFVRVADPEDGRRVFIELSEETAARMEAYLEIRPAGRPDRRLTAGLCRFGDGGRGEPGRALSSVGRAFRLHGDVGGSSPSAPTSLRRWRGFGWQASRFVGEGCPPKLRRSEGQGGLVTAPAAP